MSIGEFVRITAHTGAGDDFLSRLEAGLSVQAKDAECLAIKIHRSIERPDEYLLELEWTTVEAHVAWQARGREEWRSNVGWDNVAAIEGLKHYDHAATVKEPT